MMDLQKLLDDIKELKRICNNKPFGAIDCKLQGIKETVEAFDNVCISKYDVPFLEESDFELWQQIKEELK